MASVAASALQMSAPAIAAAQTFDFYEHEPSDSERDIPMEVPPELERYKYAPTTECSTPHSNSWPCTWEQFVTFCADRIAPDGPLNMGHLRQVKGRCLDTELVLDVESQTAHAMFNTPIRLECLRRMGTDMAQRPITVRLAEPSRIVVPESVLREEAKTHPAVRLMIDEFDASVHRCIDMIDNTVSHN